MAEPSYLSGLTTPLAADSLPRKRAANGGLEMEQTFLILSVRLRATE
jgi:hypothetical protein